MGNPAVSEAAGQWLRHKSRTELWALVQHGNPQEIIPYSIALTSKLNQVSDTFMFQCMCHPLWEGGLVVSIVSPLFLSLISLLSAGGARPDLRGARGEEGDPGERDGSSRLSPRVLPARCGSDLLHIVSVYGEDTDSLYHAQSLTFLVGK